MSEQLRLRRDTASNIAAFTPASAEVIVNTTTNRAHVGDGTTAGGHPLALLSEVVSAARTAVADAAYTVLTTDRIIAYTSISAPRNVSLPTAASFPPGVPLWVVDESGSCSGTNYIAINRNGSDTVNGATSTALTGPYQAVALESNGVNGWGIIAGIPNIGANLVGVGTGPDASNPLSVKAGQALFNAVSTSFTLYVNKAASANNAAVLFEDAFASKAQIGLIADDNFHAQVYNGSSWLDAINIANTTGQVTFPQGVAGGDRMGFRNRLRNANFAINQRAVSGTVTLAAGAYGHDGVKAGASGATYTFATSGIDVTLTITAGSLILPIESTLIEGGSYILSQAGTAQARVWQGTGYTGSGSYAAAPFVSSGLTAATQTNVEFSTGTVLRPQFEPGSVTTTLDRRPLGIELLLCQRYFNIIKLAGTNGQVNSSTTNVLLSFRMQIMCAAPTVTLLITSVSASNYDLYSGGNPITASGLTLSSATVGLDSVCATVAGFSGLTAGNAVIGQSNKQVFSLSAEL